VKVKRYQAKSYRDALARVKNDLGPDAVILTTREIGGGRFLGLVRRPSIEIVAAADLPVGTTGRAPASQRTPQAPAAGRAASRAADAPTRGAPDRDAATPEAPAREATGREASTRDGTTGEAPPSRGRTAARGSVEAPPRGPERDAAAGGARAPSPGAAEGDGRPAPVSEEQQERLTQLEQHLQQMRESLDEVARRMGTAAPAGPVVPAALEPVYRALCESDVTPELAARLLVQCYEEAGDAADELTEGEWRSRVRRAIAIRIRTAGPLSIHAQRTLTVALVGPTGVGKTTTIAKLAAEHAFIKDVRVGLIAVDTYRVAAVEQLKTFAQIMTVPVIVAGNPEEARQAVGKLAPRPELILIDTAGRSQRNVDQIGALQDLVEAVGPDEIHLVLSATTKNRDLVDITRRFGRLGANRLVFTKLDETTSFGPILNIAVETGLPISYVTSGQMVPEDLEVADPQALAGLILPGGEGDA
jgi:flagellar biosynthesis protein FlhF